MVQMANQQKDRRSKRGQKVGSDGSGEMGDGRWEMVEGGKKKV